MFIEKLIAADETEDIYDRFLNKELIQNLKRYSRSLAYALLVLSIVLVLVNESTFQGSFSALNNYNFNNFFNFLLLLSFILFSSDDKRIHKYSKIVFYVAVVTAMIGLLSYFDVFNLANFIPLLKTFQKFGVIKFFIMLFIAYSLIFKKYYKFSQILELLIVIIGFFGFFYYLHSNELNFFLSIYYVLFYVVLSSIFIAYTADKGIFKNLNLTTHGSILARRVFLACSAFLTIICMILLILHSFTNIITEIDSELFVSIGSVVFLLILMYYYATKMNYSDYQNLKSRKKSQKREILFEDIIEYTVEGVLVINKEDIVIYANQVFYELLNQDKHIIGKAYHSIYDNKVINDKITKAEKTLNPQFFELPVIIKNKNKLFNGWIIPFIQKDEFNGVIITGLDVTETTKKQSALKKSIDEKNILLTEVHHRVKNNMQIIISLLNLQSHKLNDDNAKLAILNTQSRVRSMALVHENLYKNFDFKDMNIKEYINDLVSEIRGTYVTSNNITFKLDVVKAFISIDIAVSLGLILNELLTNCIKYAFPNNQEGIVWINLFKQDECFVLIVKDNGVGPDNSESTGTGIGSTLINSLVTQIDGTYKIENDDGAKVTIKFKD
jgi:two-component sensor histidine kinase